MSVVVVVVGMLLHMLAPHTARTRHTTLKGCGGRGAVRVYNYLSIREGVFLWVWVLTFTIRIWINTRTRCMSTLAFVYSNDSDIPAV